MKFKSIATLFVIVLSAFLFSCTQKAPDPVAEKAAIQNVLEKYVVANETQNLELIREVWGKGEDIIVFGTASHEKLVGWENISNAIKQQFKTFRETYISVSDQVININRNANTAWFSEIMNYNFIFEGKAVSYEGIRFTGVLEKFDDKWLIVQSHLSVPNTEDFSD